MKKNETQKQNVIARKLQQAYDMLDLDFAIKLLKNKPSHLLINILNAFDDYKVIIFGILASQTKSKTDMKLITGLDFDKQELVLENATDIQLKKILKNLYPDEIVYLLDNHQKFEKRIILCIDKDTRNEVKKISSYDEEEVGRIMNSEILSLNANWTVSKAIEYIKNEYKDIETSSTIYVTDRKGILVGVVKIHDLFFAKKRSIKVSSVMTDDFYKVNATDEIEDAINMFDKYPQNSFPVVNSRGVLVGVIHNSDIASAIQDEATEDIYNMYGITELKSPYLHASIWSIVKSRLLWLIILMITATFTSFVLDKFQDLGQTLTQGLSTIMLVPLLPVLTGTSGNAGSQASASIIRSLSIGEITKKEYFKAILKEVTVGIIVGLILAVVNFVRLLIYYIITVNDQIEEFKNLQQNIPGLEITFDYVYSKLSIIAATTSLTLFISILISKLLGACLPILATRMNIDPTVMSAPILATILDIVTTTTLFGIGLGIIHVII